MTATSHAVLGTVIAAKIGNPALAIPIALVSHLAADAIPHWDVATNIKEKTKKRVFIESIIDGLIGFVVAFFLIVFFFPKTNFGYAFLMILVSQSFDWLMAPYYFFNLKIFRWAYSFQKKFDYTLDKPWGIITQVGVIILVLILAKIF